jgi:hypothetical protein
VSEVAIRGPLTERAYASLRDEEIEAQDTRAAHDVFVRHLEPSGYVLAEPAGAAARRPGRSASAVSRFSARPASSTAPSTLPSRAA